MYGKKKIDTSPRINAGDSPSSRIGFPVSQQKLTFLLHRLNIPSVRRYKRSLARGRRDVKRKTPYILIAKARGFTALFGKSEAFTLIELLLAATIFLIVASVIYSSFRLGVISWGRTEANLSRYQEIRYAINRLSEDITNAFVYKDIPFKGEEKRVEFAGIIEEGKTKERSIGRISYIFSGQGTERLSGKLIRQKLPYWQAVETEEGEETIAGAVEEEISGGEELLINVIDFSINYCYKMPEEEAADLEWLPEWASEEAIPAGIRLELVLKDDYAPGGKMKFTKRIHIPVGEIGNLEEAEE